MPRPPRIDFPDALYHVTSRGNGRADIFHSDDDRRRFLAQLAHHLHLGAVVLYAFVLMENHIHLLLRTPRREPVALHAALAVVLCVYWRYKHRRPGHLFQGRFKAKLVEDEAYLLAVTRYIHLNPVKIAACRRMSGRERLDRLQGYAWSSYGGYAAAAKAEEFVTYDVLKEYGRDLLLARRHYRGTSRHACWRTTRPSWRRWPPAATPSAATAFIERTEGQIEERRSGRVQDRDLDLPRRTVSLDEIDAAVARHYRIDRMMLSTHGRRVGPAKAVAVQLAAQLADMSGRAIGGITESGPPRWERFIVAWQRVPMCCKSFETLAQQLRKRQKTRN